MNTVRNRVRAYTISLLFDQFAEN